MQYCVRTLTNHIGGPFVVSLLRHYLIFTAAIEPQARAMKRLVQWVGISKMEKGKQRVEHATLVYWPMFQFWWFLSMMFGIPTRYSWETSSSIAYFSFQVLNSFSCIGTRGMQLNDGKLHLLESGNLCQYVFSIPQMDFHRSFLPDHGDAFLWCTFGT
jgi:hypothetical protein